MTQSKLNELTAQALKRREFGTSKTIEVSFDGDWVSSDGGILLLRKADEKLELCELAALALGDSRRLDLVKHPIVSLLRQRVYGVACGYEDCNDATELAFDPIHNLALGHVPSENHRLASQPTLSRFENAVDTPALKALQRLLVTLYVRQNKKRPRIVRLSMDTTHDEVHGYQQLSFYNGFYETYCYTPLFIFADDGFPLRAQLRAGNASPAEQAVRALQEVVHELRLAWPGIPIELTADAGFAVPELYEYCETNGVTYFVGTRRHNGLDYHVQDLVSKTRERFEGFGANAEPLKKYGYLADPRSRRRAWRQREERIRFATKQEGRMQEHFEEPQGIRLYDEFLYQSREWSCSRRHIVRCEYTTEGPDLMFVVTNAKSGNARKLYEDRYCKRARCENWIKDMKTYLKCDRTSCQEFAANQFRLLIHTFAYMLLWSVRKTSGIGSTTMQTVQLRLMKVGVTVRELANKVVLTLSRYCSAVHYFEKAWTG